MDKTVREPKGPAASSNNVCPGDAPKRSFPEDCPPGCPPEDAEPANGDFYMLSGANPPERGKDFRTAHERGVYKRADQCRRRSYSMFSDLEHAQQMTALYPHFGHVWKGTLSPNDGVEKLTLGTFPSHASLWKYQEVDLFEIFTEHEEPSDD